VSARRPPHPVWLTLYAGLIAASAFFGAAGLASGFLRMTPSLAARLPFSSPVFGGIALASAVLTIILAEFGDFAMMRKMLLGIKRRAEAEQTAVPRLEAHR
jgi:hypothetical protein